jgi:hypothetical protein
MALSLLKVGILVYVGKVVAPFFRQLWGSWLDVLGFFPAFLTLMGSLLQAGALK